MDEKIFDHASTTLLVDKSKTLRQRLLAVAGVFVALVVLYLLALPAITSEYNYICGLDEHQHIDSCFVQAPNQYSCGLDEHQHIDSCFVQAPNQYSCGLEEDEGHAHGEECILIEGETTLVCGLEDHIHSDECLASDSQDPIVEQQVNMSAARASSTPDDLVQYLEGHGGTFVIVITDANGNPLVKDENGHFIVAPEQEYVLKLRITSPKGILPGAYQYQLPSGLTISEGQGDFVVDNEIIGTWLVDSNGLVTFDFNEKSNNRTDVNITATMGVTFSSSSNLIDFDGEITVVVTPPPSEDVTTQLDKWGSPGNADNGQDPNRIYWQIRIIGHEDSQIPGSTITDTLVDGRSAFTDLDMSEGIRFGATYNGPEGSVNVSWVVKRGDPNLVWTSTGWTYVMPTTVESDGRTVTLGNDNWTYWIEYTSTPEIEDTIALQTFRNRVEIDGEEAEGGAQLSQGGSNAGIEKGVNYQGGSNGGRFIWTLSVAVPGGKGEHSWLFRDYLRVINAQWQLVENIENTINDPRATKVTATQGGTTVDVPNIDQATKDDEFAWACTWSQDDDGVYFSRQISLLCRCVCDEEHCLGWTANGCGEKLGPSDSHCQCWNVGKDTVFTFTYETAGSDVLGQYGGSGNQLQNLAELYFADEMGKPEYVTGNSAETIIPGVFKKELTSAYDGSVANYTITVNEAKLDLVTGDSTLTIRDEMTTTLAYVGGSLVIETEDRNGNKGTLVRDVDYTVTYDGSGDQVDSEGNSVHLLLIELLDPQPVKYILNYDAVLVIPSGTTGGVTYSNSASIKLFGEDVTVDSDKKLYADINISAESYKVEVVKTDAVTSSKLPGATFGLFNEAGNLITSGTTDAEGNLTFQTNVALGVILMDHEPYYIQELEAPEGYSLDDAKHWFVFCEENGACTYESNIEGLKRISGDEDDVFNVVNHGVYVLPETGGIGTAIYTFVGALLMGAALLGVWNTRRRRGVKVTP